MSGTSARVNTHLAIVAALACAVFSIGCAAPTQPVAPLFSNEETITDAEPSDLTGLWMVTKLDDKDSGSQQPTIIEYRPDGTVHSSVGPIATTDGMAEGPRLAISGRWVINNASITHSDMNIRNVDNSAKGQLLSELLNNSGRKLGGTARILALTATHMITVDETGTYMQYVRYTNNH
ncbi:MAG: hypothetical protein AB8B63_15940 [Granulosicoccus sp.]